MLPNAVISSTSEVGITKGISSFTKVMHRSMHEKEAR